MEVLRKGTDLVRKQPIKVNGLKEIDGMQFHEIEGGFGEGKKSMLVREIANIHKKEFKHINEAINKNKGRFKNNIDIVDLKSVDLIDRDLLKELGFSNSSIANAKNIYLLSERGYAKLLKILEDDIAWEQYDKLVDGYFNMRETIKEGQPNLEGLSPQLQALINIELQQKKLEEKINLVREESKEEIQAMRDVVAINSNDWKNDCKKLITKIAYELGGIGHINDVYREVYSTLDRRMKTKLNVRLTNKRRRMADEGVCRSKRDKLNYINVIEDDCKLIEGYVAIVKELAIKYGVA